MACHECLDRHGAEIVRAHILERAAIAADGGAGGVADEGVGHESVPGKLSSQRKLAPPGRAVNRWRPGTGAIG